MNLSKNKKMKYLCTRCNSPEINKIRMYGQVSYECLKCNRWWPWDHRKIVPVEEEPMLREDYMFAIGILIGMLVAALVMVGVYNFTETKCLMFKWVAGIIMAIVVPCLVWVNLKYRGIV